MIINAIGKACPIPVVMAKKALDAGERDITVSVDNRTAVENLSRLAASSGMKAEASGSEGAFSVRIFGEGAPSPAAASAPVFAPCGTGYSVFIGRDHVGDGAEELGYNLMKMALYTLSQGSDLPSSVLFMNGGVKLPAGEDAQVIDSIRALAEHGCEILVCGTCLNYYGITDKLQVGMVSNMYDILSRMQSASKVITL